MALALCAVRPAVAADCDAPDSGLYERYSPITMAPYGPLETAADAVVPRWLEVETTGCVAEVVVQPAGIVAWTLTYGPHGLVEKVAVVDGERWTRSEFEYADGALSRKTVTGPGVGEKQRFVYETDDDGRVVRRTGTIASRDGETTAELEWTVSRTDTWITAHTTLDGELVRIDRFDTDGRHVTTELGAPADARDRLRIRYDRADDGRLVDVYRTLGQRPETVTATAPDASLETSHIQQFSGPVERFEAVLLLGPPKHHSVTGSGVRRKVSDDFLPVCNVNQPSGLRFDAADVLVSSFTACICGFCVDPSAGVGLASDGDVALGIDEHWTDGPWIELDGALLVTADHDLVTPDGPVAAGELRVGDVVVGADGAPRTLESVDVVSTRTPVRAVNVRTRSGTFTAGDFLLVSETESTCPRN